jgi:hypothetical protein
VVKAQATPTPTLTSSDGSGGPSSRLPNETSQCKIDRLEVPVVETQPPGAYNQAH